MPPVPAPQTHVPLLRLQRLFLAHHTLGMLQAEKWIYGAMAKYGIHFIRISLGIVFLWFGALKLLHTVTPIDRLAERTLVLITLHLVRPETCLHVLAVFECIIGIGFITGRFLRLTLILLFLQMPGTFLPLILLRHETWIVFPVFPTFEGQYIVKNLVLVAADLIIGATSRGGRIIAHPGIALKAERAEIALEEKELKKHEQSLAS